MRPWSIAVVVTTLALVAGCGSGGDPNKNLKPLDEKSNAPIAPASGDTLKPSVAK